MTHDKDLTRQKLEVAQVFKEMLGIEEALAYLRREGLEEQPDSGTPVPTPAREEEAAVQAVTPPPAA